MRQRARILEAAPLHRLADHDRLGFLRKLRRDVEHRQRQHLGAARELVPRRPVVVDRKRKKTEIVERKAAPVRVKVLYTEGLVALACIGEVVQNDLSSLATLLFGQCRLHPHSFTGNMLDNIVR